MLTIWGRTNSINVQKVLWCCEELGLPYRRIDAGGEFGQTATEHYVAINPNMLVPTLDDGKIQLWESNVIVRYLCHKHAMGTLCPSEAARRFDAERWMDWQATVFWPALRPLFISLIRTADKDRDFEIVKHATESCASAVRILDARLADRSFIAGDSLSMGDIPIGTTVHRWYALDISHSKLPHLERWYRLLQKRAGFRSIVMTPLS